MKANAPTESEEATPMPANPPAKSDEAKPAKAYSLTQTDRATLPKGDPLTESREPLLVLALVMVVGLVSAIVYALQLTTEEGALAVAGVAVLLAGASALAGGMLGFLFGVPRTLQQEGPNPATQAGVTATGAGSAEHRIDYRVNTNLEQISDWLTKILVGVSLTQIPAIRDGVRSLTAFAAQGLGPQGQSEVFAFALLSYFTVLGFLFGYLWTRLFFTRALRASDQATIGALVESVQECKEKAETAGRELDELKKQAQLDAEALSLAYRLMNPSRDVPPVTQEKLDRAVALASEPVKVQIFNQAWQLRSENWRDPQTKPKVELTIPLFRALIHSDTQNKYHRNHAQLGYALKDKPQPDWAEAEKALTTAIERRGPWQESGWLFYELNRAQCRIMLDPAFQQDLPSDQTHKSQIVQDLQAACHVPELCEITLNDRAIGKWMGLNKVTEKDLGTP